MAPKSTRSYITTALNNLSEDAITFPSADNTNLEALIYDYFNKNDESRSDDDEECNKEFSLYKQNPHQYSMYIGTVAFANDDTEPAEQDYYGKLLHSIHL